MAALANARGARQGVPPVVNAVEQLEKLGYHDILDELRDEARAVLTALHRLGHGD